MSVLYQIVHTGATAVLDMTITVNDCFGCSILQGPLGVYQIISTKRLSHLIPVLSYYDQYQYIYIAYFSKQKKTFEKKEFDWAADTIHGCFCNCMCVTRVWSQ